MKAVPKRLSIGKRRRDMFDIGYPKKTGDKEKDMEFLYSFVCELSDRLRFQFKGQTTEKDTKNAEKQ